MKKIVLNLLIISTLLFSFLWLGFETNSPTNPTQNKGTLMEKQTIKSEILGESVNYSVYIPHTAGVRRYPVTYVLHGYTDDETAWVQFGEIDRQVDKAIANGTIPPMILIMPDAKVTWYVNDAEGKKRYEDFFIQELIPHVDATYPTRASGEFRGITGLSMGGYGSLIYAMKNPDLFVAAAPLSAAIYTEETVAKYDQGRWDEVEGPMYGKGLAGKERISEHWKKNNPFYILKNSKVEDLKKVKYFFDCGDDDFLYEGNSKIHIAFRDAEIPHEFRMRDGAHSWSYWRTGIIPALEFIGDQFHR